MNGFQLLPKICVAFLPLSHQTSAHVVLISTIWCGSLHSCHGTLRGDLCSAPVFVGCVSLWCLAEFSAPFHGEIDLWLGSWFRWFGGVRLPCFPHARKIWESTSRCYTNIIRFKAFTCIVWVQIALAWVFFANIATSRYIMIYACISMAPYFTSCIVKKRGMGSFLNTVWMSGINNLPTICNCATATTLQRSDGSSFKWIVTLMTLLPRRHRDVAIDMFRIHGFPHPQMEAFLYKL